MERPAEEYPNGPELIITSFSLAPFLFMILFVIPKSVKLIEISLPSLVSPPRIFMPNSFDAFPKPRAKSSIFFFESFLGKTTETIPKIGLIPFAAKSLIQEIILYLAIYCSPTFFGISVLSTNVSIFKTKYFFPILKYSTSSDTNLSFNVL